MKIFFKRSSLLRSLSSVCSIMNRSCILDCTYNTASAEFLPGVRRFVFEKSFGCEVKIESWIISLKGDYRDT